MSNPVSIVNIVSCAMREWGQCGCVSLTCETHKKEKFNLIVTGSRTFNDFELLERRLDKLLAQKIADITIYSGTSNGADKLGELYANQRGFKIKRFPADRGEMVKNADALVAFWDGHSEGTKHMINLAKKNNLKIRVIEI